MNRKKESEYLKKLSKYLEINYIKGDDLTLFQETVKPVYEYFINKGMFTMDEIKMAQKIAKNKN